MSRFFKVVNTVSSGGSNIDDDNISTDSTYSSFEITQLLNDLSNKLIGCDFLEYSADIRASPEKIFETPDSSKGVMWVLREGVKMTKDIDYIVTDNTHIEFVEDVSEKYTVSILVIGNGSGSSTSTGTGGVNNSSVPIVFLQNTPTTLWEVNHCKKFQYPKISVVDDSDYLITDSVIVQYVNEDKLIISSEVPFKGKCIVY